MLSKFRNEGIWALSVFICRSHGLCVNERLFLGSSALKHKTALFHTEGRFFSIQAAVVRIPLRLYSSSGGINAGMKRAVVSPEEQEIPYRSAVTLKGERIREL